MDNCTKIDSIYEGGNKYTHLFKRDNGEFFLHTDGDADDVISALTLKEAKKWVRRYCDVSVYVDTFSGNSRKFCDVLDSIIRDDIFCCMTDVTNYILNSSDENDKPYTYDDIEWKGYEREDEDEDSSLDWYEVWEVSDWLADKLYEKGSPVIRGFHSLWFRGTTGQSIGLDWIIRDIVCDLMKVNLDEGDEDNE